MGRERTVAIVGAGMSGLAAAALLAREGWRVRVVDAAPKVGGSCRTTTIAGYTFDDGAVCLVFKELLERVFDRLGLELDASVTLRRAGVASTTWLPGGAVVTHRDGVEVAVEGAGVRFDAGRTREELRALVAAWSPLRRALSEALFLREPSVLAAVARLWRLLPRLSRSVASELHGSISDPAVRSAIAASVLFTGQPPERAPAVSLVAFVAAAEEGLFVPEGGMGRIPEALARAVLRHGGEILLDAPVERILVGGGRARGLAVRGHGSLAADAVISTAGGFATFAKLLDAARVPAAMRRRTRALRPSHRSVSVQLGLRNRVSTRSLHEHALPHMEEQHRYFGPGEPDTSSLSWVVPTNVEPALAAHGGSIVELFPPVDQSLPAEAWDEARKARVVDATLETLSRHHAVDVAVRRVRGPRELASEMGLHEGTLYGLSPTNGPFALFPRHSGIVGLYLAGQTTHPGFGVAPAAASGMLAAEAVLRDLGARGG